MKIYFGEVSAERCNEGFEFYQHEGKLYDYCLSYNNIDSGGDVILKDSCGRMIPFTLEGTESLFAALREVRVNTHLAIQWLNALEQLSKPTILCRK